MARGADFDLAAALATPSFTPAQRDAPALVDLVVGVDEKLAARAATALVGLGEAGRTALAARLAGDVEAASSRAAPLDEAARARLVGALGQLARRGDDHARALVIAQLGDGAARVRRAAIGALGNLAHGTPVAAAAIDETRTVLAHGTPVAAAAIDETRTALIADGTPAAAAAIDEARTALLARWDAADVTPDERRALAEALGKVGGDGAIARLRALVPGGDAELARRRDRALLVADREAKRGAASEVVVNRPPPAPIAVRLHCKPGLADLLVDELRAASLEARADGDAAVELVLAGPWQTLFAARLWITAGIRVPRGPSARPQAEREQGDLGAAIVDALVAARPLLAAWTRGPIRWRLELPEGKQRAVVWRVARDVAARAPELVNDPTQTTWDVLVPADAGVLELVPRRIIDPRFAYRVADIPAASHPTVAAALARVAEARPDDRVWDPFVGSGLELVERAKLGPFRWLAGTDLAKPALAAAHANLDAAGISAALELGDSRAAAGERDVDLVITNPPLGSRVQVDAAALLVDVLPVIARRLVPRGRLVWLTPAPKRTTPIAQGLGLRRSRSLAIDLGGVRAHLERWDAPAPARPDEPTARTREQ
jgi:putative RNA methylase family UPF0020